MLALAVFLSTLSAAFPTLTLLVLSAICFLIVTAKKDLGVFSALGLGLLLLVLALLVSAFGL